jgi:hypothetical protein
MAKVLISFGEQNLRVGPSRWLFQRRQPMRFEWLALLAFKRLTVPGDQAWVSLEEISRLPHWSGRSRHHIATNLGRYLQSPELDEAQLVTARTRWAGPYRLNVGALSVDFDVPVLEARKYLRLHPQPASMSERNKLLRFVLSYARARWLFFQGRLIPQRLKNPRGDSAYQKLMRMAGDRSYNAELRLLACLSAVDVLYRIGRFKVARQTLLQNVRLLRSTSDFSLKARFHLKLAWAHQRASSGRRSDCATEAALSKASSYGENSGDRAVLGLLAERTAGYLTKKQRHMQAVNQFIRALEAYLSVGDYDGVQATCGNIGSVIHRLGPKSYGEARRWLLLSIGIARWMGLGRDDAHAEMILGKIYAENGKRSRSQWLLQRAENVAQRAGNQVNLADIKMVWGFWQQRFGTRAQHIKTLVDALNIFRSLSEFDTAQKEKYMARSFPEVWDAVLERVGSLP